MRGAGTRTEEWSKVGRRRGKGGDGKERTEDMKKRLASNGEY